MSAFDTAWVIVKESESGCSSCGIELTGQNISPVTYHDVEPWSLCNDCSDRRLIESGVMVRKKSYDDLDDDEGWTDDPYECRGCNHKMSEEEWEAKNCSQCGTRNTLHPKFRKGMTAFDMALGLIRKSTPLQEEIENQKELGMEVNVETGDVQNPDMGHALYNLYDHYDRDTGEKIEKSMTYMDKGKRGLWDNVHAKKKRGEKAAKPGDKDYPDKKNWDKLTKTCNCGICVSINNILEKKDDKPFHGYNPNKHSKEGGLNAKGRAKAKREEGANLKPPVTEKPSTLNPDSKKAKRRKSFCARMGGVKGPTSKGGKKTPKGAALDRWNC